MKDRVARISRWILYVLLILSAIPGILFYTGIMSTDVFLDWGKFMLILSAIVLLISPVYTMVNNPQNLIKMVISLAFLVVIIAVSYGLASNQLTTVQLAADNVSAETSRLVGMGLYAVYITLILSIIAILYSAVVKIFK